jgi:enoyl-CoA hydratase
VGPFEALTVEEGTDRLLVRLNRPSVRNAIDRQMVEELHRVCADLEENPRILILTGSEGVFASGADIKELRERRRDDALAGINSTLFARIARLPLPVIAALDGYALGGGPSWPTPQTSASAPPSLKIGNPKPGSGILAAAGASWRLKELVGEPLAKEILLAGRILTARRPSPCA